MFIGGQSVQSRPLRVWKLGLTTSLRVTSHKSKCDMDVYMASPFGGDAWDFVLRVGSSKKLDPPLKANLEIFWQKIIKILTLMDIRHTFMGVFEVQKSGLCLHGGTW